MNLPNNGFLVTRQSEAYSNMQGEGDSRYDQSALTQARIAAEQNIRQEAAQENMPIDSMVTTILNQNQTALMDFITDQGEVVVSNDPVSVSLQACLLRAAQIAHVAKTLGISDYDALCTLETAESENSENGLPDGDHALQPEVAACVKMVLDHASDEMGDCSMQVVLFNVSNLASFFSSPSSFNNIMDGDSDMGADSTTDLPSDNSTDTISASSLSPIQMAAVDETDPEPASAVSVGSSLAQIPNTNSVNAVAPSSIAVSASSLAQAGPSTSAGGVMNAISTLNSLMTGITAAANSTAGAAGAVKNAISNVGANSIATYIQNNMGTILIVVALIVIIIYAVTRKK